MDIWVFWLIIAVVLGVAEIFTLTAALGMLGGAAVIASVFVAIGLPMTLKLLAFAFTSVSGVVVLQPITQRHRAPTAARTFRRRALAGSPRMSSRT